MLYLLYFIIFAFPLCLSLHCLKRALLDAVRQDVFRLREQIYVRVSKQEISLEDDSVSGLVRYLHGLVDALENWDFMDVAIGIARSSDKEPMKWLKDVRLKKESSRAMVLTMAGLFFASAAFRTLVIAVAPFVIVKGRWDAFMLAVSARVNSFNATYNNSRPKPA
jgi:hypothetical protein